jgi:hypothetical protein
VTFLQGRAQRETQLFLECSEAEGVVARVPANCVPEKLERFTGPDWPNAFLRWAATRDPAKEQFVLLLRPDGVPLFGPLWIRLEQPFWGPRKEPFVVGWDVWPPERSLFSQR